jgi:hypothetical protein
MTRHNDPSRPEWATKVLTLIRGGNLDAALAQIKVAPSVKDPKQCRPRCLPPDLPQPVDVAIADQIDALPGSRLHRSP